MSREIARAIGMKYLATLFCGWVLGGMTLIYVLMRGEKFK